MTEAIVIGGGVIGASTAFHLTRRGVRGLQLLERHALGSGPTARSGAIVRVHYTSEEEARLALAARPWFEEWAERVGGTCGYQQAGYLLVVGNEDASRLRDNVTMLRRIGADTTCVDAAAIHTLQPGLDLIRGEMGAYEARSGYADPRQTTLAFAEAAARSGAIVREGVTVTGIEVRGGRVVGVRTADGSVRADVVVIANGAWAASLLRPLGIEVEIFPTRAQLAMVQRPAELNAGAMGHVVLVDRVNGFYCRPWGESASMLGLSSYHRRAELDGYSQVVDRPFTSIALRQATKRLACFYGAKAIGGQADILDLTLDRAPVLGPVDGVEGLFLAIGMSGAGFKKAPAVGACLAEVITSGVSKTAPIDAFRLDRFRTKDYVVRNDYSHPAHDLEAGERAPFAGETVIH